MSNFDELVDRTGMSTVKQAFTPACVTQSGHTSMWGAEFEFSTAPFVRDAVVAWAQKGLYAYTVENDDFRALVCRWMKNVRQWEIHPEWIVPVYGITASLATAMRAFTQPGDGIIGLDPVYHMYWVAVELSGRRRVSSPMVFDGLRYTIDWADLEAKMADPANKIMLVCNPENPTAKVFSEAELREIGRLAEKYDVLLYNDEIFAECVYEGIEMHTFGQFADCHAKVITATSLGKWLSFTGTNQANLIIPDEKVRLAFLAERDKEFYGSMNPMMLPAYTAAYTPEGAAWVKSMMRYVTDNYRMVNRYFQEHVPGFHAVVPQGTFILWVDARGFCSDAKKLDDFLIHEAHFHVDPGVQYNGEPGFFRMTLSLPREQLWQNLQSLSEAVNRVGRL